MGLDISGLLKMKSRLTSGKTRLMAKTFKLFACCTAVCFALTAPLFYLLTKCYYAEDMIEVVEAVSRGQGVPPIDFERDVVTGMMIQFLLIFVVITLSLYIMLRFMTKKLWQPFDDTLHKAEQFNIAQGELPVFCDTDIQEFDRLNQSLALLMSKSKETFRTQKEFTENASHELQTPLAIIRSKLDLLMQEDMTESQMKLVSDLYGLTTRMEHFNRNLLLLAKIVNTQYAGMEEVDVAKVLAESLPLYDALRGETVIKVEDHRTKRGGSVVANAVLLECLLKNLVVNALRYSAAGGEVLVEVEDSRLTVSNDSDDGVALDAATLFCRFSAGGDRRKGNGLGLAIVKTICDFHHWSVGYEFAGGKHRFVVDWRAPKS